MQTDAQQLWRTLTPSPILNMRRSPPYSIPKTLEPSRRRLNKRPPWLLKVFMQPLPSAEISAETETAMKELVEKYRPVRQRTVRGETTKDKAGALPPAVYTKPPDCSKVNFMPDEESNSITEDPERLNKDVEDESVLRCHLIMLQKSHL